MSVIKDYIIYRKIYIALLCLLAVSLTTSNFFMNLAWVLLLVVWIVEGGWREKWSRLRQSSLLQFFLLLFAVHLVAMIWTSNWHYGFFDIQKKLPLLAVPLVVLTSKPLSAKEIRPVLTLYAATVFVVTVIGWVRFFLFPELPYRDIVPYISHIRFSLNICLVILLLFNGLSRILTVHPAKRIANCLLPIISVLAILWFLAFLLLIRSYTAMAVLAVLLLVAALLQVRKRWWPIALCAVCLSAFGLYAWHLVDDYYGECDRTGLLVENGRYVYDDFDIDAIRDAWPRYSNYPIDSISPQGYSVEWTALRYLNSLGLPKNDQGLAQLDPNDFRNIEQGIANVIYTQPLRLRSMAYSLLFEYENYRCSQYIGESSALQRVALWRAACRVFLTHPIFGVGTGDAVDACHEQLRLSQSSIADTDKHPHNQYLSLLAAFGLVGFIIPILPFFVNRSHSRGKAGRLFVLYLTIVLISFLTEDTLETLAGVMFVSFFSSLFSGPAPERDIKPPLNDLQMGGASNRQQIVIH